MVLLEQQSYIFYSMKSQRWNRGSGFLLRDRSTRKSGGEAEASPTRIVAILHTEPEMSDEVIEHTKSLRNMNVVCCEPIVRKGEQG